MTLIPLHCDTYYSMKWLEWVQEHIGEGYNGAWGLIMKQDGTALHYVDLYIEDPELAILFRLSTGI